MGNYVGDSVICLLILVSVSLVYGLTKLIQTFSDGTTDELFNASLKYNWIVRLCMNLLGYATVLLPGYLIYKYVRFSKYLQKGSKGCLGKLIRSCFIGNIRDSGGILDSSTYVPTLSSSSTSSTSTSHNRRTFKQDLFLLIYCFVGLQTSYLTWGYLQEKIMTQVYVDEKGEKTGYFQDSQFLVFINRILAFLMSGLYLLVQRNQLPRHTTPLYKYAYCSLSNIMSSWCQYEALKFVSFPTQVLAKASKIIPVMIMGKIISRSSYEYYEYVTAVMISIGMTLFMLGSSDDDNNRATTCSGVILLCSYLMLDSFTSNWQNAIFVEYGATSVQMMCAVNMFSCLLTATSLLQQSSYEHALQFMMKYPRFVVDCLLISICSASGQLYIFYTISKFGPVTFVIIMTIRQGLAVLLSCLVYHHRVTIFGVFGIFLVFGSVFLRIYCNNRLRAIRKRRAEATTIKD